MTADSTQRAKTTGKSQSPPNKVGYMAVQLTFVVPAYTIPEGLDISEIDGKDLEMLTYQLEESENLAKAQHLAQLTAQSLLELVEGSRVFYNGLVGFAKEEEILRDDDSSR